MELVGYHAGEHSGDDFVAFAEGNPALLDKRLLTRFYRPATLANSRAKTDWVEPDLAPFPWQNGASPGPATGSGSPPTVSPHSLGR